MQLKAALITALVALVAYSQAAGISRDGDKIVADVSDSAAGMGDLQVLLPGAEGSISMRNLVTTTTSLASSIQATAASTLTAAQSFVTERIGKLPADENPAPVYDSISKILNDMDLLRQRLENLNNRVLVVESELVGPQTCKDVANELSHVNGPLRSQYYDIYPDGTAASRVRAWCEFNFVFPRSSALLNDTRNLALGRPTAQSTTGFGGTPNRAVDGNADGNYNAASCTHTAGVAADTMAWWMVDLGADFRIGSIVIKNRDIIGWRLYNAQIRIGRSSDAFDATKPFAGSSYAECNPGVVYTLADNETRTISCSSRPLGRYITIGLMNGPSTTLTLCEVQVFQAPDAIAPWTVLLSQPGQRFTDPLPRLFNRTAPSPLTPGVLGPYMNIDLKSQFTELYVENDLREFIVFQLSDFTGPLILNPPASQNVVDAAADGVTGIIYGNNFPVVTHFQVGQVCVSADCRRVLPTNSTDPAYSLGSLVLFDFEPIDSGASIAKKAHFGGTDEIERLWSRRGRLVMVR